MVFDFSYRLYRISLRSKDYIGRYPLSKTLRFELKPQGKTREWIDKRGLIEDDEQRAKDYLEVKKIMDSYHKDFIDEVLGSKLRKQRRANRKT